MREVLGAAIAQPIRIVRLALIRDDNALADRERGSPPSVTSPSLSGVVPCVVGRCLLY